VPGCFLLKNISTELRRLNAQRRLVCLVASKFIHMRNEKRHKTKKSQSQGNPNLTYVM